MPRSVARSSPRSARPSMEAMPLTVEIWSDVVCPWCYIGKRRFEAALRSFEHAGEVEVDLARFELDPRRAAARDGDPPSGSPRSTA